MRARPHGFALFAAALALSLGACNAITGLSDDYHLGADGRTNGGDGGPGDGTDGGGNDGAGGDGQPGTDGGPTTDGAPGGHFCPIADAAFCEDFEDPSVKDGGLTSVQVQGDASVVTLDGVGRNGSRGLDVYFDKKVSGSQSVWSEKVLAGNPPEQYAYYEVQYDFRVQEMTSLFYFAIGILAFPTAANSEHGVAAQQGPIFVELNSQSPTAPDSPAASWHTANIKLTKNGTTTQFTRTITVDNVQVDTGTTTSTATSGTANLRFGTFSTSTEIGKMHVSFDNLFARRW